MASVSSHILDSVRGTHAAGIRCVLWRIDGDKRTVVFEVDADHEGRIAEEVVLEAGSPNTAFELVLRAADYFAGRGIEARGCVREVVLRFVMRDDRRYHLPVMLSPNSYSTWWSG